MRISFFITLILYGPSLGGVVPTLAHGGTASDHKCVSFSVCSSGHVADGFSNFVNHLSSTEAGQEERALNNKFAVSVSPCD